jgi:ElaB/YqjD/DUF883 family membrane-anchored ribosome-binding protein
MTEDPDQIRDGVEQTPDQIRDDIEQTQRELSADVDALTAKISPQRVVHDKFQRARTAMGSMKERVTGNAAQKSATADGTAASAASTANDTASSAKGTVTAATSSAAKTAGTVAAAARRGIEANPVAAVLIAFGAGWLIAALLPSPVRRGRRRSE